MQKSLAFPRVASMSPALLLPVLLAIAAMVIGCGKRGHELAPVGGKATYRGAPLKFGSVTFQPESGRPSTGMIQPDGTFQMITHGQGDGAAVGKNQVCVGCFEKPAGDVEGLALGKALIPRKYLSYATSGIVVEVRSGANDSVVLDLKD